MELLSFGSSSKGNCYLLTNSINKKMILIDVGIAYPVLHSFLLENKIDEGKIEGALITHSHTDHIKGLKTFFKHNNLVKIITHEQCFNEISKDVLGCRSLMFYKNYIDKVNIAGFAIEPIFLSHDKENIGLLISYTARMKEHKLAFITDTGEVSSEVLSKLYDIDTLILEANYDVDMLNIGPYPYPIKSRIKSSFGHLSNNDAAKVIVEILKKNKKKLNIFLAHISENNNTPQIAVETCLDKAKGEGFKLGKDFELDIFSVENINNVINF